MKHFTTTLLIIVLAAGFASAQSKSYITLREKFAGEKDVFAFRFSGGLTRMALRIAGEYEFYDAIRDVKNIRFIVIPKSAFHEKRVSLSGFKKVAKEDGFEELAHIRDHGDDVQILLQPGKNDNNRYLVLVDGGNEVVAIEVKGYINPDEIRREIAYNTH
jgi:hypothetical protein